MMLTDLTKRFIEKVEREKTNLRQTAADLCIPYDRLYKWSKGKSNPKPPDDKVIEDWVNGELKKVPLAKNGSIEESKAEPDKPTQPTPPQPAKLSGETVLEKMLDSNLKLTYTLQTMADSHKNITVVAERLSRHFEPPTVDVLERSLKDVTAKLRIFQEVLEEFVLGKLQIKANEIEQVANTRFHAHIKNADKKGNTQTVQDSFHK